MVNPTPITDSNDILHTVTPSRTRKVSRYDAQLPCSTPRRSRAAPFADAVFESQSIVPLPTQRLSVRLRATTSWKEKDVSKSPDKKIVDPEPIGEMTSHGKPRKTLEDLPLEIQGLIFDYLFGDICSVTSTSTSLQPGVKRISSAMRHPRRKALTDLALVSSSWRQLVQERIYRHIKIKGNRAGLAESTDWFSENFHLTKHVRHIEFWVPVWADKSPNYQKNRFPDAPVSLLAIPALTPCHNLESDVLNSIPEGIYHPFHPFPPSRSANNTDHGHSGFTYPFSSGSTAATLSEIFSHIACFFSQAQIFTLEGGHCKKSHMIRQFPTTLFPARDRRLDVLPNVRTFVMRGAWNIMRDYPHWTVIQKALPQVQEWHCGYAKPRPEAYITLNSILSNFPTRLRRVDISLDGFYCKDGVEGNGILGSSPLLSPPIHHLCERLGRIASQLESLRFTGRICECFFRTATEVARSSKVVSPLHTIDIIVKSCCRLVVVNKQPAEPQTDGNSNDNTGDPTTTTTAQDSQSTITAPIPPPPTTQVLVPSSSPSDSVSGITNMTFIRTFERLILSAIKSLDYDLGLPQLSNIRIRYIDLDSTRPLLNPYFVFSGPDGGRCEGLWNEEIVEALGRVRPGCRGWEGCEEGMGMEVEVDAEGSGKNQSSDFVPRVFSPGFGGGIGRRKPRAIKGSAYRDLADGR